MREGASLFIFFIWVTSCSKRADFWTLLGRPLLTSLKNTFYIIHFWVLFPQLIIEVLPHDFYMTNYIKDIYEWRNNIFEREYNKSTMEYLPKLQYFNNFNIEKWPFGSDAYLEFDSKIFIRPYFHGQMKGSQLK